ncbi:MAG: phosphoesterase PA-phosphatase related protein [uncultured bacterium]|nr:MAG: phosphoesterase PA-phosphatase related protein [uncultured bacterium]
MEKSIDVISHIKSNLKLKIMLGFILTFYVCFMYSFIQHNPIFSVKMMNTSFVDNIIPFIPNSVYLYESILLLMPIAPWLMTSKDELKNYTLGIFLISGMCFLIFFLYPTSIFRPSNIYDSNFLYFILIKMDNQLNAFPSLHAALAIFHGACCSSLFRKYTGCKKYLWLIWFWIFGIMISTLLTKQHIFIDIVAGSLIGLSGYYICCYRNNLKFNKIIIDADSE